MKQRYVVLRDLAPRSAVTRGGPERTGATQGMSGFAIDGVLASVGEAEELRRDGQVSAMAPAMPMRLVNPVNVGAATRSDPGTVAWGVQAVGATTSPFDGRGIRIAVLDTGIDASHPAFEGVRLKIRDFTGDGEADQHGHGTHCAGTIFGREIDGMRIGVAPGVTEVFVGKVLGRRGCSSEEIANAVQWAVENNAHVISMSLGIDFPGHVKSLVEEQRLPIELATSQALENYRANVLLFERLASMIRSRSGFSLVVSAAGNESRRDIDASFDIAVSPPAVSEGIVSVAAVGRGSSGWRVADFSNVGAVVCAPG